MEFRKSTKAYFDIILATSASSMYRGSICRYATGSAPRESKREHALSRFR